MGEPVFRFHFANFLRFMHTKESKTCVLSLAKPLYCVNRNPCFTLASACLYCFRQYLIEYPLKYVAVCKTPDVVLPKGREVRNWLGQPIA